MEMIHVLPKIPVSNYYEKSFKKGAKPSPFRKTLRLVYLAVPTPVSSALSRKLQHYAPCRASSRAYIILSRIGVKTLEAIIKRITDVKYSDVKRPTDKPFCATINATSPRVIMPTPIFKLSENENLQSLAISPQPMIFASSATTTNPAENKSILPPR